MSLSGILDVAVYLDSVTVFSQKLQGSLRLAVSVYRKVNPSGLLDKLQTKVEKAQPFLTADQSMVDSEQLPAPINDVIAGDLALFKATPYILTDSFIPQISVVPSEGKKEIKKAAYFRVELPNYPLRWSQPVCLQVDLLMKPSVLMVGSPH